jgi:pyruvate-formate lyase
MAGDGTRRHAGTGGGSYRGWTQIRGIFQLIAGSVTRRPRARPLSVLQGFGKIDYKRICNGGPLTLELSDGLFRGKDSLRKVGLFIRAFVESGCQQMQLNTLNVETLRDAQRHPERHKNLVVRVWGWSGYFCELDEVYQNQIIGRNVHGL